MESRQHTRGRRQGRGPRRPGRTPPPDETGAERRYFESKCAAADVVVVQLRDGREMHGTVTAHGEDTVQLNLTDGGEVVLRVHDIRTIGDSI